MCAKLTESLFSENLDFVHSEIWLAHGLALYSKTSPSETTVKNASNRIYADALSVWAKSAVDGECDGASGHERLISVE